MRPFTRLNPPTDPAATEDAFAEFAPEPAKPVDAEDKQDWFAEFPDERSSKALERPASPSRSKRPSSFFSLSESLKDEKA
jgi:hypothetical protein